MNTEIFDGTDIAELMECFKQTSVSNPKFPAMIEAVKNLKETEGGTSTMCDIVQRYIDAGVEKGKTAWRAEGRAEGISRMAANLRGYGLTEAQIAELVRKSSEDAEAAAATAQ